MLKSVYVISVSLTAILVYGMWCLLSDTQFSTSCNFFNKFGHFVISALLSPSFFLGIQKGILCLLDHSTWIRKLLFRKEYIEGYWVGYHAVKQKKGKYSPVLLIEKFEQTATEIYVYGKSYEYKDDKNNDGALLPFPSIQWDSFGYPVTISGKRLAFAYTDTDYRERYKNANMRNGFSNYTIKSYKKNFFFPSPDRLEGKIVEHTNENRITTMAFLKKIENPYINYQKNRRKDEEIEVERYLFSIAKKLWKQRTSRACPEDRVNGQ